MLCLNQRQISAELRQRKVGYITARQQIELENLQRVCLRNYVCWSFRAMSTGRLSRKETSIIAFLSLSHRSLYIFSSRGAYSAETRAAITRLRDKREKKLES